MKIPERTTKLSKNGTAVFSFVIATDGSVRNVEIIQSVEYSFDEAFAKILSQCPKWVPAFHNGKAVNAYRRQPMTIRSS